MPQTRVPLDTADPSLSLPPLCVSHYLRSLLCCIYHSLTQLRAERRAAQCSTARHRFNLCRAATCQKRQVSCVRVAWCLRPPRAASRPSPDAFSRILPLSQPLSHLLCVEGRVCNASFFLSVSVQRSRGIGCSRWRRSWADDVPALCGLAAVPVPSCRHRRQLPQKRHLRRARLDFVSTTQAQGMDCWIGLTKQIQQQHQQVQVVQRERTVEVGVQNSQKGMSGALATTTTGGLPREPDDTSLERSDEGRKQAYKDALQLERAAAQRRAKSRWRKSWPRTLSERRLWSWRTSPWSQTSSWALGA